MIRIYFFSLFILFGLFCHKVDAANTESVIQNAMSAVVQIKSLDNSGEVVGSGSGFFIKNDRIMTNLHVIAGANQLMASLVTGKNQKLFKIASVVAIDKKNDLAILKIIDKSIIDKVKPLKFSSVSAALGAKIFALGNPLGIFNGTVSEGLISSLSNKDSEKPLLQISAPISPGSSGGPIINAKGEVVGVVVAQWTEGQNINFAVPLEKAINLSKNELKKEINIGTTELANLKIDKSSKQKSFDDICIEAISANNSSLCMKAAQEALEIQAIDEAIEVAELGCVEGNDRGSCLIYVSIFTEKYRHKFDDEAFAKANKVAAAGCKLNDRDSCYAFAEIRFRIASETGEITPVKKVYDDYLKLCNKDNPYFCFIAGKSAKDISESDNAVKAFKMGCDLKQGDACYGLVHYLEDEKTKDKILKDACSFGSGAACLELAKNNHENKSAAVAKMYFLKSCERFNAEACMQYSSLYGMKDLVEKLPKAIEKVCKYNEGAYCLAYALVLQDKSQVLSAINIYERHCKSEYGEGCFYLGKTLVNAGFTSSGIAKFINACELKVVEGCIQAGRLLAKQKELAKGNMYFEKGCDLDDAISCMVVGEYFTNTLPNEEKAKKYFVRGYKLADDKCENQKSEYDCLIVGSINKELKKSGSTRSPAGSEEESGGNTYVFIGYYNTSTEVGQTLYKCEAKNQRVIDFARELLVDIRSDGYSCQKNQYGVVCSDETERIVVLAEYSTRRDCNMVSNNFYKTLRGR